MKFWDRVLDVVGRRRKQLRFSFDAEELLGALYFHQVIFCDCVDFAFIRIEKSVPISIRVSFFCELFNL